MHAKDNRKIVLFLWAGASAPFGYPTTSKFIEGLRLRLEGSNEGFLLDNLLSVPHVKDIEHVLQILEGLQFFRRYPIKEFVEKFPVNIGLSRLSTNLHDQLIIADLLKEKILDDIYRQYEFDPKTIDTVVQAYEPLVEMISILRGDAEVPIFTTNYDRVIEEFSNQASGIYCVDGFKFDIRTREFKWNPKEFEMGKQDSSLVKLFKLHGSLDWRKCHDGKIVKVGSEERTRGSRRFSENILIYPAEKVKPEMEPFRTLHEYFVKYIGNSDSCVFIGFSFRDDYLNSIIDQYLDRKKIIIVSPNATQIMRQNLLDRRNEPKAHRIFPIDASFGEIETLPKIEEALLKKGAFLEARTGKALENSEKE
jgi:hypothetical protein